MYTNNKLAKSIRLALMFGGASVAFAGTSAVAQEADEAMEEAAERIQVTGSRIKRTDMEGAVPVTVIDREAISLSGETSISDVIRGTTFNSAGSFRPQSGSSAQGTSSVDLRGIGSNRTLILVDGRRLPKSPSTGQDQDLNSIPLAAVERIEVLSDGASAVYGSDAIGGVINVVTRTDMNGAELKIGGAQVSIPSEGGDREEGSAVFGTTTSNMSVLGGVSWNNRDIIYENAYPWVEPGRSAYGNNWFDTVSAANGGLPGANGIPGGCTAPNYNAGDNGQDLGRDGCYYNFNATNANEASTGNKSIFIKGNYQINNDWNVYMSAGSSQTKSFGRYAPSLNDTNTTMNVDSVNNPTNPAGNVYDPATATAGPRQVDYLHRFASLGNRDNNVENIVNDLVVGAEGRFMSVDWDFGLRRNTAKTYEIGRNYLLSSAALNSVNTTAADLAENPDLVYYDLRDPLGTRFAGDEAAMGEYQDLLNSFNVTTSRIGKFNQDEAYISGAFDIAETNAGIIQAIVGFEYRKETYLDQYDSLSESGSVGGSSGSTAGGSRNLRSMFFETLIPITYDFEVTVAGRQDDYSDYGSDFSPKVSAAYSVSDELKLRASWGQGFRAPSLDILTAQPALSADSVRDADSCAILAGDPNEPCQVQSTVISNPDLGSEQSEQIALGLAYQPTDWLNLTFDYYSIEITDRIATLGAQTLIDRVAQGDPIPPAFSITRDPDTGQITQIIRGSINEGDLETNGFDLNAVTNFDFGAAGSLGQNLQIGYINEYRIDGGRDFTGDQDLPQMRANLTNTYRWSDFTFGWNINYIDSVAGPQGEGTIGSWTTNDVQVSYDTPYGTRFTLGARNVFEKEPPLVGYGGRAYNFNLYDAYGRVTYFRLTQTF